jgi:hypothetical protein
MSPSTQQLTGTISSSAADLGVFIMMLFIVLFGFTQAFNLQFGSQVLCLSHPLTTADSLAAALPAAALASSVSRSAVTFLGLYLVLPVC